MDCSELGGGQLVIFDEKCKKATLGCRVSAAHLQWSTSRTDQANYANTRSKKKTNTIIASNNYTYVYAYCIGLLILENQDGSWIVRCISGN